LQSGPPLEAHTAALLVHNSLRSPVLASSEILFVITSGDYSTCTAVISRGETLSDRREMCHVKIDQERIEQATTKKWLTTNNLRLSTR
jgi:hypothetical protein